MQPQSRDAPFHPDSITGMTNTSSAAPTPTIATSEGPTTAPTPQQRRIVLHVTGRSGSTPGYWRLADRKESSQNSEGESPTKTGASQSDNQENEATARTAETITSGPYREEGIASLLASIMKPEHTKQEFVLYTHNGNCDGKTQFTERLFSGELAVRVTETLNEITKRSELDDSLYIRIAPELGPVPPLPGNDYVAMINPLIDEGLKSKAQILSEHLEAGNPFEPKVEAFTGELDPMDRLWAEYVCGR